MARPIRIPLEHQAHILAQRSDAPPAIHVEGVCKYFGTGATEVRAVDEVDLLIDEGEFISIVGPSGCGKTTLLRIIGGLVTATRGNVAVLGTRIDAPTIHTGFVFQSAVLLPWKTNLENVLLPLRVRRRLAKADFEHARELMHLVGLSGFEDRYPFELSGGMQQRVSICRALAQDPVCLLLDEPFGALDAMTREKMNIFVNRLWRETRKTIILVTHSIHEAAFLSTRVAVMSARPGRIKEMIDVALPPVRGPETFNLPEYTRVVERLRAHFLTTHSD